MAVKLGRRAKEWEGSAAEQKSSAALRGALGQLATLEIFRAIPPEAMRYAFEAAASEDVDQTQDALEALLARLIEERTVTATEDVVAAFARTLKGIAASLHGGDPYPPTETLTRTNELHVLLKDMRASPTEALWPLAEAILFVVIILNGRTEALRLAGARPACRGSAP